MSNSLPFSIMFAPLVLVKVKGARCSVASVMSDSLGPHGLQSTRLLCPWDFPDKNTGVVKKNIYIYIYIYIYILEWVAISYSRGSCKTQIEPMSPEAPALVGGFYTAEPPGKPGKNKRIKTTLIKKILYKTM